MDSPTSELINEFLVWRKGKLWIGLHKRPGGRWIEADTFDQLDRQAIAIRIVYDLRMAERERVHEGEPR